MASAGSPLRSLRKQGRSERRFFLGGWGGIGFLGFFDSKGEVERDMSKLRIGADSISGDESDVLTVGNGVPIRSAVRRLVSVPRSPFHIRPRFRICISTLYADINRLNLNGLRALTHPQDVQPVHSGETRSVLAFFLSLSSTIAYQMELILGHIQNEANQAMQTRRSRML